MNNGSPGSCKAESVATQCRGQGVRKNPIGSAEKINKFDNSTHKISKRSHEGMVDG